MSLEIRSICDNFQSSTSAEQFIRSCTAPNISQHQRATDSSFREIVISEIVQDIIQEMGSIDIRTWQWQAYRSLFNAQMKYYSCHRNLVRYASDKEDEYYAPSVLSTLEAECRQRERDALMVGIKTHMVEQLNKLCMMIS